MLEPNQLIYRSRLNTARIDQPLVALRDILRSSASNNVADDITGYLLFDGVHFLQVLEGNEQAVQATFARIGQDARHKEAELLKSEPIPSRAFARWSMGGYFRDERDLEIFKRHGVPTLWLADVSADQALGLITDLAAHRKTIAI